MQPTVTITARAGVEPDLTEADLIDAMNPGAAATIERLAGITLTSFGLVYLVLLGDICLSAFLTGTHLTTAIITRIVTLGAVFTSAVLSGMRLSRPTGATPQQSPNDARPGEHMPSSATAHCH